MKFNLWKTDYLVDTGLFYVCRYVITTSKPSREVLEAMLGEEESLEATYGSAPCIGVGTHGELLWGEQTN